MQGSPTRDLRVVHMGGPTSVRRPKILMATQDRWFFSGYAEELRKRGYEVTFVGDVVNLLVKLHLRDQADLVIICGGGLGGWDQLVREGIATSTELGQGRLTGFFAIRLARKQGINTSAIFLEGIHPCGDLPPLTIKRQYPLPPLELCELVVEALQMQQNEEAGNDK